MLSRRTLLSILAGAALSGAPVAAAAATTEGQVPGTPKIYLYNIPAQPLQPALVAYAGIVGTQIIYDAKLARNMRSHAVIGLFTADTALRLLISGTDFTVVTTGDDVVLVPQVEIRAGHWPGENSNGEMTLVLDTLYVAVPPGAQQRPDYTDYGQLVRAEIRRTLTGDPKTARRIYNARFEIWIDPKGAVGNARLARSSGSAGMDIALTQVITRIAVDRPPPQGMPQPIYITVIGI